MIEKEIKKPELLVPAGDWSMLNTAIKYGADAVYFGIENLNMRATANNFSMSDLYEIVSLCHSNNVKAHLTLNTIIYEHELNDVDRILKEAKKAGIDMIICWDLSVIQKCLEYNLPFCISTQASVSNSESAKFYQNLGAKRIVLARECTLDKIREIKNKVDIQIEIFIHGAMCIAVSGRCFMSHELFNKSANRGECLQPCRREYEIKDLDENNSLILGDDYILSPKDLCTINFLDKLIESGIHSFKIEGRKRSPEYVSVVTSAYRKAIDSFFAGTLTEELKNELEKKLKKVYNRGFSNGFYFGAPGSESYANIYGSVAETRKVYVGKIINYFKKTNIAHLKIETGSITEGDQIYIIGNTTGVVEMQLPKMICNENEISGASKGMDVTFVCNEIIRDNDKVYKIVYI